MYVDVLPACMFVYHSQVREAVGAPGTGVTVSYNVSAGDWTCPPARATSA